MYICMCVEHSLIWGLTTHLRGYKPATLGNKRKIIFQLKVKNIYIYKEHETLK